MTTSRTDILIIGGGVPGLTLASVLGQIGVSVIVADSYPPRPLAAVKPDGRTVALMEGSVNILKATGAWDLCADRGEPLKTMRIIDDSAGRAADPVQIAFSAYEIGMDAFGINMPNTALRAALGDTIKTVKSVRMLKAALETYEVGESGITARFDTGETVTAKLIVGADGRNSQVRHIAGIGARTRDYGQKAITCLIDHTKPHDNTSTEFHRPSGPFAIVPLPGLQSAIVWVEHDEQADRFMALSKHAFEHALQERTGNLMGTITLATSPHVWPLTFLKADRLTGPRSVLMAEAAHVISPMGAQGLNLSLRDAASLAENLADSLRLGLDPGSAAVLARYERQRRRDVASRVTGTDALTRMVSNDIGILRGLRRIGLKTLDAVTPLKTFAMHQGLAPQLENGRLARGDAL